MTKTQTFFGEKSTPSPGQEKRLKGIPLLLVILGALLVGSSLYWTFSQSSRGLSGGYDPADVVQGQPLQAVHDMEPFNLGAITFLPKGDPQPSIFIPETFYDFGRVGPKEVVSQEFVIANRGAGPLTISRASTTCGCTTAEFTASVIPPGKVAIMKVTFD